jgi:hypothetical protein
MKIPFRAISTRSKHQPSNTEHKYVVSFYLEHFKNQKIHSQRRKYEPTHREGINLSWKQVNWKIPKNSKYRKKSTKYEPFQQREQSHK